MRAKGVRVLLWVTLIHLAGIYLYAAGFLLAQRSSFAVPACPGGHCTLPPVYRRLVFLVIDSLRFDFISPDPPYPSSLYHNALRLPGELSKEEPDRSLLFAAYADPPTTTLQRIKALTTGSLPSYIDMGSSFGESSLMQDSLLAQMKAVGRKIAFMGDDTWISAFPTAFTPGMIYPFDSFNIEDLHTVDDGIATHLFPLLREEEKSWDAIVAHFLGVDHAGHRFGPDHPMMKNKLEEMDTMLRDIVALLDDDTLLVLLGDHGMDRRGNHGCDTELEVSTGLWIYGKQPFMHPEASIPPSILPNSTFPGASVRHRSVQQVDLVPSIALLLGLHIPSHNLGSIIPELFWNDTDGRIYDHALRLNVVQVQRYLDGHRESFAGDGPDDVWSEVEQTWQQTAVHYSLSSGTQVSTSSEVRNINPDATMKAVQWSDANKYLHASLAACRRFWARFNFDLIAIGLIVLLINQLAVWALWFKLSTVKVVWDIWVDRAVRRAAYASICGALLATMVLLYLGSVFEDVQAFQLILSAASLSSSTTMLILSWPSFSVSTLKSSWISCRWPDLTTIPISLILHTAALGFHSFVIWEDRIIPYLLLGPLVIPTFQGIFLTTHRLRNRILGFSVVFASCVCIMSASTVCREEQYPHCQVTFFAATSISAPPISVLLLALPSAVSVPYFIRRILALSQSDGGLAALFLPWLIPSVLVQSCIAWMFEWLEVHDPTLGRSGLLRYMRTALGWSAIGSVLGIGCTLWWTTPLCFDVTRTKSSRSQAKAQNVGTGNAYGSSYLLFWCIALGIVYTVNQLTAQIVLGLSTVAVVAYLELLDGLREVRRLGHRSPAEASAVQLEPDKHHSKAHLSIEFSEIAPLALLVFHTFYSTGHQSTISSVQWKSAFVFTPTANVVLSLGSLVINEFGPQFLVALATPLLVLWNLAPLPHPLSTYHARRESVRAALGMMLYHGMLMLGSAVASVWLRRHALVWKIIAPRFIIAALTLVAVDVALLVGIWIGVSRISDHVVEFAEATGDPQPSQRIE